MPEFKAGDPVRVLRRPGFAHAYKRVGVIIDHDAKTTDLYRRYMVEVPTDGGTMLVPVAADEIARDRPLPPPLEFETPPCSVCGTYTEYDEGRFRCPACGIWWGRDGAHLHEGHWDDPAAEQCPDVLTEEEGRGAARKPVDYRCLRTAGHKPDHVHPDVGEWARDEPDGGDSDA